MVMKYSTSRNQFRYKWRKFWRQLTWADVKKVLWVVIGSLGWILFIICACIISAL